ncbi:MAG: RloB family protein [Sulfurospirillaceae bacterium]|nr:RloB family protein [Sulfurospirillaceae bacterium]
MGTEDLHKRAKSTKELGRKKAQRSGDLILIVCEGKKTEPNYLKELLQELNISTTRAVIEVTGDCGSAPQSVVEDAIKRFEEKNYDHIFCVIDKDKHPRFNNAIKHMGDYQWTKKKEGFKAKTNRVIVSVPCFEYWLLLHFQDTTQAFAGNAQETSPCKECIRQLKSKSDFGTYEKGSKDIYHLTKKKLETAMKRAKSIVERKSDDYQNPITYFHELIEFLRAYK